MDVVLLMLKRENKILNVSESSLVDCQTTFLLKRNTLICTLKIYGGNGVFSNINLLIIKVRIRLSIHAFLKYKFLKNWPMK